MGLSGRQIGNFCHHFRKYGYDIKKEKKKPTAKFAVPLCMEISETDFDFA